MPDYARYLWIWYFELSASLRRVRSGVCEPIPPSEWTAWQTMTGNTVRPVEYSVLREMDLAYCEEMNKELKDYETRERERMEKEREAARRKR